MMGGRADVVMSDMAANTTGHRKTDQLRIIGLVETAAAFAADVLNPGGTFLAKVFQSGADAELAGAAEARFRQRAPRQAGLEPAGFLRALRAGDGVSGTGEVGTLGYAIAMNWPTSLAWLDEEVRPLAISNQATFFVRVTASVGAVSEAGFGPA